MVAIKRFLCCFDVTEGSYISGLWTLIAGSVRISLQVFILRSINGLTDLQKEDLPVKFSVLEALSAFRITLASGTILASLILLAGMWQSKHKWLLPWLVWVLIDETANFCIMVSFIIRKLSKGKWTELDPSIYAVDGVFMFLDMYCVLCVYSCFKHMKKNIPITRPRGKWSKWAQSADSNSDLSLDMSSDDDDVAPLIIPETINRSRPV